VRRGERELAGGLRPRTVLNSDVARGCNLRFLVGSGRSVLLGRAMTLDRPILALLLLPVLAVISLGFLARALVDGGGNHWAVWALVLAASCGAWFYVFTTEAP
jgi:hypothetical protein